MATKGKKLKSKKAAIAAAQKDQAKKKPQPKSKVRAAKKALEDAGVKPFVADALREDANKILPEVREQVALIGNALAGSVELDKRLQDVRERELWKYCDTPFKSWTAYVGDLKKIAGKSAATLWGIIGLQKALPESTAEQRKEIGPRKGAVIKRAAKVAKKKGQVLPPEIVEKAQTQSAPELERTVEAAGFSSKPDPLIEHDSQQEEIFNPRAGGSGVVEGESGTAQQFSAVLEEALEVAEKIYAIDNQREALHFIYKQWLLSPCEHADFEDMTNSQALDHLKKNKKVKSA